MEVSTACRYETNEKKSIFFFFFHRPGDGHRPHAYENRRDFSLLSAILLILPYFVVVALRRTSAAHTHRDAWGRVWLEHMREHNFSLRIFVVSCVESHSDNTINYFFLIFVSITIFVFFSFFLFRFICMRSVCDGDASQSFTIVINVVNILIFLSAAWRDDGSHKNLFLNFLFYYYVFNEDIALPLRPIGKFEILHDL